MRSTIPAPAFRLAPWRSRSRRRLLGVRRRATTDRRAGGEPRQPAAAADPALLDRGRAPPTTPTSSSETGAFVDATEEFLGPVEEGEHRGRQGRSTREHGSTSSGSSPWPGAFGDLDPDIDGREGDIPPYEWGGYHRIEKALWVDETTEGPREDDRRAAQRRRQPRRHRDQGRASTRSRSPRARWTCWPRSRRRRSPARRSATRTPTSGTSRPTSRGPRPGSRRCEPALKRAGPRAGRARSTPSSRRCTRCSSAHREGDGFVLYDTLSEEETQALAQQIDTLGEPLSQVPPWWGERDRA